MNILVEILVDIIGLILTIILWFIFITQIIRVFIFDFSVVWFLLSLFGASFVTLFVSKRFRSENLLKG